MTRSWSPASCRRHHLEITSARGLVAPAVSRARRRPLWICLALLLVLASGAAAQAPDSEPSGAKPLADQEPITPIPPPPAAEPRKLALGERLFGDHRLSADGKLACSSCHDLRTNGAGGGQTVAHDGSKPPFDTLTVFNAALNFRMNWEGNFRDLGAHVESSLENPVNMRTSVDASALSPQELGGYQLFKSLGCSSCHQGVNVGGNLFERQGVFRPLVPGKPEIVRVPSLRNVATTPPYFHDGSAPTLEEAVHKMAAAQLDRTLTDQQVDSLVAFLKTLTGTYRGVAVVGASQ